MTPGRFGRPTLEREAMVRQGDDPMWYSAKQCDGPDWKMVTGPEHVEHGAGSGTVGCPQPLEENVIQSAHRGRGRATLGRPGVPRVSRDLADAGVIHVAPDHHVRMPLGVGQNSVELVAPSCGRQPGHGPEVD